MTSPPEKETRPEKPEDAIIEDLRVFLNQRFDANLADARRSIPPHICVEFGRRGYTGLLLPKDRHGCGLTLGEAMRVIRFLALADLSIAVAIGLHNILGLRAITLFASAPARAAFEEDCGRGRRLCAFALTETLAGSDPRRIATTARRQKDGSWILNGSKRWTGIGAWCGAVVTFAQAYDEEERPLGVTGFIFAAETAGFRMGAEAMTMGLRGIFQGALHFDHLRVPDSGVLGKPGEGLAQASQILLGGRLGCVAFASGAMHRCVQIAGRYSAGRKIATGTLAENGTVSDAFARMMAKTVATDVFFDWLCAETDRSEPLPEEIYSAAKIVAPEWAFQVADGCMQLMGGRGYEENNVVARVFRDIRVMRIFEGPTETILYHLGGSVLRTDHALQKLLTERLASGDIFQIVAHALGNARAHRRPLDRGDQHRWLNWLGEIVSFAVWWAVVRTAGAETPAARITEQYFRKAVHALMPTEPWASAAEIERLSATCEAIIGDVQPHQPGENWEPDF